MCIFLFAFYFFYWTSFRPWVNSHIPTNSALGVLTVVHVECIQPSHSGHSEADCKQTPVPWGNTVCFRVSGSADVIWWARCTNISALSKLSLSISVATGLALGNGLIPYLIHLTPASITGITSHSALIERRLKQYFCLRNTCMHMLAHTRPPTHTYSYRLSAEQTGDISQVFQHSTRNAW